MTLPFASLSRNGARVQLVGGFPSGDHRSHGSGGAVTHVEFRATDDAVRYLRFWKPDAPAMASLRGALRRHRPLPVARLSNDEVIEALAVHLARGELVLAAETVTLRPSAAGLAMRLAPPSSAAQASRQVLSPADVPPAPLLPKLEEVQIEGAMVLPEVLQTLEQLELTMGQIDLATASLEPTPSGLPPVDSALRDANGSIGATLDGL
ncbi:MAG: hypothetical protein WD766_11675 [Gemmatimonadota bacterium]